MPVQDRIPSFREPHSAPLGTILAVVKGRVFERSAQGQRMQPLRIFIGWDSREDLAFQVCRRSLEAHSSIPLNIYPIRQFEMRERGLFWRAPDSLSSTEFSFTRFLTPYLANFRGWAVFVDCDFLFRKDIAGLLDYRDPTKALYCVQHHYLPEETVKMDGRIQTRYPRKNWSSLMWINCEHPLVKNVTPEIVNNETGLNLHRFSFLNDEAIGSLPTTWNYLEGWHSRADCEDPAAVHFTRGGPWLDDYNGVEYGGEWRFFANKRESVADNKSMTFRSYFDSKIIPPQIPMRIEL